MLTKPKPDSFSGDFTNRPRASNVSQDFWYAIDTGDARPFLVNLRNWTCACAYFPNCRHLEIARAQRRYLIHAGYAIRKGREFLIPDADRLVIAQLKRAFRRSRRGKGGSQ